MAKLLLIAGIVALVWFWWQGRKARATPLTEREARAILGVGLDDGPDAITAAHRRLITAVHPDKGGSVELARRINAARDTLMKQSSR